MAEIIFLDKNFQSTYGAGKLKFPDELADKFIKRGIARLANTGPMFNPSVNHSVLPKSEDNKSVMLEDNYLTDVVWVGTIENVLLSTGHDCGFNIHVCNRKPIDINMMLVSDIIVIGNDLPFLQKDIFALLLKICIFQKRIPFIYHIKNKAWSNTLLEKQCIMNAVSVLFDDEELYEFYDHKIGGLIQDHTILGNPYKIWRALDTIVKRVK